MTHEIFCLMGPTASGKTDLALELAKQQPVEIISVDSVMIYRELDIGSAKPTIEEQGGVPHHLIDILDPTESYSAASFCQDAKQLCREIIARGNIPLLVGGTMMYFNALQQGLSVLPESDENVREQIYQLGEEKGWEFLHQQLQEIDAKTAAKLHPHDRQRIARALEVYQLSGQPLSALNQQQEQDNEFSFINLILFPENRAWLHERINLRFEKMLAMGFLDEVRALRKNWPLTADSASMRSVGYRQAWDYLEGTVSEEELLAKGQAATRQLAKRQLTWLRQWPQKDYLDPQDPMKVMAKMMEILDNGPF